MKDHSVAAFARTAGSLLPIFWLTACASHMTDEERQVREIERYERKLEIQTFVAHCEGQGRTVIYTGPTYQKLRDPIKQVPSHARLSDYRCAGSTTVAGQLGTGG